MVLKVDKLKRKSWDSWELLFYNPSYPSRGHHLGSRAWMKLWGLLLSLNSIMPYSGTQLILPTAQRSHHPMPFTYESQGNIFNPWILRDTTIMASAKWGGKVSGRKCKLKGGSNRASETGQIEKSRKAWEPWQQHLQCASSSYQGFFKGRAGCGQICGLGFKLE